jgi:hypothetical protein
MFVLDIETAVEIGRLQSKFPLQVAVEKLKYGVVNP